MTIAYNFHLTFMVSRRGERKLLVFDHVCRQHVSRNHIGQRDFRRVEIMLLK